MKYRTKLYLFFTLLILLTALLGAFLAYAEVRRIIFNELRSKVLAIAATAAGEMDGDLLKGIQSRSDVQSASFQELVGEMRRVRNANRRSDVHVLYIYVIRPSLTHPHEMEVVVDASENLEVFAYPGDLYAAAEKIGILSHLNQVWSPSHLVTDSWGTYLVGYAPIYDGEGNYVATLGVNLSAAAVDRDLGHLKAIFASTTAICLIAGLIAAAFLSHWVSRSLEKISEVLREIGSGHFKARAHIDSKDEFGEVSIAINKMAKGIEEHERLKINFVRYVSKHIMEKILAADMTPSLKGERRKITVLFSDIREFTRLAERLAPEQVVALLNEYLEEMLNAIFAHNGTLDKFMGDGLMVEFGAPLDDPEQEKHAVQTAIAMHAGLKKLNRKWAAEGRPQLEMGIGIHTGQAVVGNIGSEKRMEYTAIGDTVNVAAHLEQATKELKTPILLSEVTVQKVQGMVRTQSLGTLTLAGRETPLFVYAIIPASAD